MNLKPPLRTAYRPNPASLAIPTLPLSRPHARPSNVSPGGLQAPKCGRLGTERCADHSNSQGMRQCAPKQSSTCGNWVREWLTLHEPGISGYEMIGVFQFCRQGIVLDQHDGLPARVFLPRQEFEEVQMCWEQHQFPRDLYIAGAS